MAKKKPQSQKPLETEDDFPKPGSDDQVDEAATAADEQQSYEQAPAAEEPKAPREESASGKNYREHPKFSKFRRERS